jgi:hypothetical protein
MEVWVFNQFAALRDKESYVGVFIAFFVRASERKEMIDRLASSNIRQTFPAEVPLIVVTVLQPSYDGPSTRTRARARDATRGAAVR